MLTKQRLIDYIISAAVFSQSILVILELYWVDVLQMNEEMATTYRVLLTAVPMSIALLLGAIRRPALFVTTYVAAGLCLLLSVYLFPATGEWIEKLGLRFTLPLVVGSALCLLSVYEMEIIHKTLYWISYIVLAIAIFYFHAIYTTLGGFSITDYNMSFSYALLLPMASLYAEKKPLSLIGAGAMMMMVVLVGSRGAAVFFVLYVFADIFLNHKKLIIPFTLVFAFLLVLLPAFSLYLDTYGIESRTITQLMESDRSDQDSGRLEMYAQMWQVLNENWFTGIGLFGDRVYLDVYCHNIVLEVLLNFGMLFGTVVILFFGGICISVFYHADLADKNVFLLYFMATICPLFVSHSYLTDYNFGIFVGMLGCIATHTKHLQTHPDTP